MRALIGERVSGGSRGLFSFPLLRIYLTLYLSENVLYFGCRSASKDSHYADEWNALVDSQQLVYHPAFSRDPSSSDNSTGRRTYVQDLMARDKKTIWELLGERNGWLYISGYVSRRLNLLELY